MQDTKLKIAVSAGELSGDQHAAKLVTVISEQYSDQNPEFIGMGGEELKKVGVKIYLDAKKYGSVNGFNIFKILFTALYCLPKMALMLYKERPAALILIDYPDFNLRLARIAKFFGIKTIYFIPPKVWAWRSSRVKSFKKYIDLTLTIFPFETEFFKSQGYENSEFIGHPFSTTFNKYQQEHYQNRNNLLSSLNLIPNYPTIAVLPGSRPSEIKRHLKTVIAALKILKKEISEIQAVIALAPSVNADKIQKYFKKYTWIKTSSEDSKVIMNNADTGILKSGTCNLEAAFLNLPFVCFYKGSAFASWMVKKFVKLKYYSLVNILRPGTIKEMIQENARPDAIAKEIKSLIYDQNYRAKILQDYTEIREILNISKSHNSTYQQAAEKILPFIKEEKSPEIRKKVLPRLFQHLLPYKKEFILALVCMVIFGATDGALPLLVKEFLDGVFASQNKNMLYALPVILLALALIRAASGFFQEFLMAKIGHNIVKDIRNKLHQHLLKLNPDYYARNSSGNLLARFTSDVLLIKDLLTRSSSSVIRDTIRIIALVIAAIYLDSRLALIALVAFPVAIIPIYNFGRRIRKLSKKGQNEIGMISSLIQETVAGNRVIKLFNQETLEQQKFENNNAQLTKTFIKSEKVQALSNPVNEILAVLAICGVILYGGHAVMSGARSQGEFIAFLVSIFLLYDPFKKLSKVYHQMQQGASGAERIFEVLDSEPAVQEKDSVINFPDDIKIEFKNVSFSYPETEEKALKNINLSIAAGQKVALVGFSGSGKSTLADLLPRFIDPTEGQVLIGNQDLRDLKLTDLRQKIAMVNQSTFLFNDTVFNNISYGTPAASKEAVEKAAHAAYAHGFIMNLPKQYETFIGEDGATLSGGERQRIAIARAILKDAPVLILDEATAALDNQSENEVQKALEELESGRTALIIAHRLSTIRNADLIVVMEKGQIIETGTHDQLLTKQGAYMKLHELQFRSSEKI